MKDFLITVLGIAAISALMFTKETGILQENWGTNPSMSVSVSKEMVVEGPAAKSGAAQALGLGHSGGDGPLQMVTVPPNLYTGLAPLPRSASNISYGAGIMMNLGNTGNLAVPAQAITYGSNGSKEGYDEPEGFEPISSNAAAAMGSGAMKYEKAQALADQGLVKAAQPSMSIQTPEGKVDVTVYDRLMYSNSKSRLYGQGDPIRGDIGCIVPIKSDWFRPSVRPNIDLRPGAMTIMGGIDNETPKELRALQSIYSAGTSRQGSDAYANTVNPGLAQKSMGIGGGPAGGQTEIVVSGAF